jgi:hypothetical protein
MIPVAALFVETGGHYFGLPNVDPWDEARDARAYDGPHPVVAHPPCQLWVNFAALNFKRYGGEHNRPGHDGGCFASALLSVRAWGGVLEHPAFSNAWAAYGLTRPNPAEKGATTGPGWLWIADGPTWRHHWVCEVWQSAYGHKARKRTWLYAVTAERPQELDWSRRPGVAQVGWFDRIKPTLSKKAASATPPDFRNALLQIARQSVSTG